MSTCVSPSQASCFVGGLLENISRVGYRKVDETHTDVRPGTFALSDVTGAVRAVCTCAFHLEHQVKLNDEDL